MDQTLKEAMLHKAGLKKSAKIEAGVERWPELFKEYREE